MNRKQLIEKLKNDKNFILSQAPIELYDNDREIALLGVKKYGHDLQILSKVFQDDFEVVFEAINNAPWSYREASIKLKSNPFIIQLATKKDPYTMTFISEENQKHILLMDMVKLNGLCLRFVKDKRLITKEIVMEAVKNNPDSIQLIDSFDILEDENIFMEIAKLKGTNIKHGKKNILKNREIVLEAVKQNFKAIAFVSEDLKDDFEIIKICVNQNGLTLRNASKRLQDNIEIVLDAVRNYNSSLEFASQQLKSNVNVVMTAVKDYSGTHESILPYVDSKFYFDEEFVMEAIKHDPLSLLYIDEKFSKSRDIVKIALSSFGGNLKYLNKKFQKDEELIVIALQNGGDFQYVSEKLKNDRNFCFRNLYLKCFHLYNEEFRKDEKMILEAIKYNAISILNVSNLFVITEEFLIEGIKKNGNLYNYLGEVMQKSKEICMLAYKNGMIFQLKGKPKEIRELQNDTEIIWVKKKYFKLIREVSTYNLCFKFH
eukprot:gene2021-1528_t